MYGHADLIALLERLAHKVPKVSSWPGLLVGDISQARGGPMLTGHASHQVGLDADIWLTPMPKRELTRLEREEMSATDVVAQDRLDVDPNVWTRNHVAVIRAAAQEPAVERIFVNAAIKKALCRDAGNGDRSWLSKVRPMYGHNYHFHIRIRCPAGSGDCEAQDPPTTSEGCSAGDFAYWFSDSVLHPKQPTTPPKPRPPMTLAQLPAACKQVLLAP
jgi:penicillin-insensitive murein endopeptidase